jgi:2-hydroxy-6-oxonona-2,4-dienedioate hydrolase
VSIWSDLLGTEVLVVQGRYRTRVLAAGSGEPLLLLHGQGGHAENFRHNIAAYAQHYRVLVPDFLWHGLSEKPPMTEDLIGSMVDQVVDLLDTLGISRVRIEGQSMGGWVATALALRLPARVQALVLTTPMGLHAAGDEPDEARLARVRAAQLTALDAVTPADIRRRMSGLFADPTTLDDEIVEVRRRIYADGATNAALRQVAERYFDPAVVRRSRIGPEQLATLDLPVLVYWGTANPTPPEEGRRIAACIPGSRWHCAEVGHWAQYEKPEEHNRVVLDFLGGT